jgi:Tol biopolymer transport system component
MRADLKRMQRDMSSMASEAAVPSQHTSQIAYVQHRRKMPVILAAALAAVLIVGIWLVLRRGDTTPGELSQERLTVNSAENHVSTGAISPQVYRFTSYPGVETMPSFSPDGKEIAYVRAEGDPVTVHLWQRQGQGKIYVKLVGAATELQLTKHSGADYYPVWSPDGQYIAFYRYEPGASGFYMVSAFGGQERRITNDDVEISGMAWLPDGHRLVASNFSEASRSSPLIEISLDTGQQRALTSPPANSLGDAWPAISPDGKILAFVRMSSRASDICFASLNGADLRCWPFQGNWPEGIAWTPSGDGIIVSAIRAGPHQLWRCRLDGASSSALTSGEEEASFPTSSAYVLHHRSVNVWGLDVGSFSPVNPAGARPIASSTRQQMDPAFSPDGRKIAFLSDRTGAQEIWVADLETQSSTQLTHFGGPPTGTPTWSPDGLQIAFDSEQGRHTDVFAISADGGPPRRITAIPADNCVPSWSRDGKSIYFASDRSGEFQVWRAAAIGETSSRPATQVTRGGGFLAADSPDGKSLYYAKGRGKPGLWRRNLSNGKEEPVLESLQEWGWWAVGPKVIYFFELPPMGRPQVHLKAFDIAENRVRELGIVRYPVVNATLAIAVSRDGRHLAYTQVDSVDDDIMLMKSFR